MSTATINRQLLLLREVADEVDQAGAILKDVLNELDVSIPYMPNAYTCPHIRVADSPSLREAFMALYWAHAVLTKATNSFEEVSK